MFCSQCGTYNDKTADSCVNCGTQLGVEQGAESVNVPQQSDGVSPEPDFEIEIMDDEETVQADEIEVETFEKQEKPAEVKEYILWAIISAILFSIPFGTAAVIFSGFTNTERKMGNMEKAAIYSEKTRFFCVISTVLAVVKAIAGLVLLAYIAFPEHFQGGFLPF